MLIAHSIVIRPSVGSRGRGRVLSPCLEAEAGDHWAIGDNAINIIIHLHRISVCQRTCLIYFYHRCFHHTRTERGLIISFLIRHRLPLIKMFYSQPTPSLAIIQGLPDEMPLRDERCTIRI